MTIKRVVSLCDLFLIGTKLRVGEFLSWALHALEREAEVIRASIRRIDAIAERKERSSEPSAA